MGTRTDAPSPGVGAYMSQCDARPVATPGRILCGILKKLQLPVGGSSNTSPFGLPAHLCANGGARYVTANYTRDFSLFRVVSAV